MTKSESIKELAGALAVAQGVIQNAAKDSANPFFNSSYADLASVRDAIREPFAANGLAVMQLPSAEGQKVTITTVLSHKSGEWVCSDLTMNAKDASPQAVGSAITYARRYALAAVAGVAPEDDDGEGAEGRATTTAKKPPIPPKQEKAKTPPAPQQTGDTALTPWAAKFRSMYEALGKEQYSQILGTFGYERQNEIPDQKKAKEIIDAMNLAAKKGAAA